MQSTRLRVKALLKRRELHRDLEEELRFHLAMREEKIRERGADSRATPAEARRRFGNVSLLQEACRDLWTFRSLEIFFQDVRYGARMLRKNPGFTILAVLTLALGIGANTAIFSVIDAVLLRPLPFPQAGQLMGVYATLPSQGVFYNGTSYTNFQDWRAQNQVFEEIAAYQEDALTLTGAGEPQMLNAAAVTPGLFPLLRVRPLLGSTFSEEDDRAGSAPTVLLSERIWRQRFATNPALVGNSIVLDGREFLVKGILPASFNFPFQHPPADLWIPARQGTFLQTLIPLRGGHYLRMIARLKPGISRGQAQAGMQTVAARLAVEYPRENKGWGLLVEPYEKHLVGDARTPLLILLGAVGLVLLIACVNVTSLVLARSTVRTREMVIRTALGAGGTRLLRQLLTESVLLSLLGGGIGFLAAYWGVAALRSTLPQDLPRIDEIQVNLSILGYALGISLLAGIVFGLLPARQASKTNLQGALRECSLAAGESAGGRGLRGVLVVVEVSLAVVLLAGAGLLIRSYSALSSVAPGFEPASVQITGLKLPGQRYAAPEQWPRFYDQLLDRLRSLPGVQDVGAAMPLPLTGSRVNMAFKIPGEPQTEERISADYAVVSSGFLRTMKIPVLRGREFNSSDSANSEKVCLVSEAFARHYFPGQDAIGQNLIFGFTYRDVSRRIVGIVSDVKFNALSEEPDPMMYVPYRQDPLPVINIAIRLSSTAMAIGPLVRRQVDALDSSLALEDFQPMASILHDAVNPERFRTLLLSLFGLIAVLLASVGIYGVLAYDVSRRTRELAIRMALGADPHAVMKMILARGLRLALVGLGIGLIASLAVTRLMDSLLFAVSAGDPWTFFGVSTLLLLVALLACYVPARRAMQVDPMVALRDE
ncbi:MAG: ADOP family duplicated permease [Candidatus Acidiferrales bacterium]